MTAGNDVFVATTVVWNAMPPSRFTSSVDTSPPKNKHLVLARSAGPLPRRDKSHLCAKEVKLKPQGKIIASFFLISIAAAFSATRSSRKNMEPEQHVV